LYKSARKARGAPRKQHDIIINLQGDLPTLEPEILKKLLEPFELMIDDRMDIMTLAAPIAREEEKQSMHVVKPIFGASHAGWSEAIDFVRGPAPEPMYHHIGVYAYRRAALEKFVALPPSARELEYKLEQLRALDAGMRVGCVLVNTVPLGVDTPEDLEAAREILAGAR
jgi:3-deoxy-manno-octulosonate cytidylyltransferase (CMP-KDO synthetase)